LEALKRGIKELADEATKALQADLKRPPVEAVNELLACSAEITTVLKSFKNWAAPEEVQAPPWAATGKYVVYSKPKGVVLIIGPFNFPIALLLRPLIGAISAGNCCILKPSEMTPESARVSQKLVENYLDRSAFKVIQGGVSETTELLKLPFDHFFYTGNGRVGKLVMKAAAEHLASCTLELGGKSPVYVHEDANLDVTARRIIHKKFTNDGQVSLRATGS
jgi:aldehyde dehydrogenase (NAD+)